ncbi:tetratricopeptide repeat protein [Taklimakanibacter deserti]|uniref:tetratricopeptide repeat protein n=1 Tax=Taklimakanibacter deserti TaxID=2267839 RepID=UPI000E6468D8
MTRGEKIAWIWVWSAMALFAAAAVFAAWHYSHLPLGYFRGFICSGPNGPVATSACERIAFDDQLPVGLRTTALRRLIDLSANDQPKVQIDRLTLLIELEAATPEDWNLRGLSYYSLHDYEKAAKDFEQAARLNNVVGVYWSNLGDAQIEIRKYKEAFDNYTTAMKNGNDTPEVLGNRGWASYQLGNYEKAAEDYARAIEQDPRHADNLNERGLVRHALGEYESALGDYDRALTLKPDNPIILTNRAITHVRIGNADKAREDLVRAIAADPNYEPARVEITWLLIEDGEPERALAELQALEHNGPLTISALEARSRAHLDLGHWQETIADVDRALALGATSNWPYDHRAKAKRGLGDYEGAIADLTVLIARDPKNIDLLATRAIVLQLAGRTQAALDEMNRAITDNNDPAYAYEIRSNIHLNAGQIQDALTDVRQSVTLTPQSPYSAAALGWTLLEDQKSAEAIRECSRSLTIRPTAGAYACRAIAELALQKTEAAQEDAYLALRLNKRLGLVYLALGRADLAQDRPERAMQRFSEALKFDIYERTELYMYRGDAEAALGHFESARSDYETARKFDTGLRRQVIDERLAKLPSQ